MADAIDEPVVLSDPDPAWETQYDGEAARVRTALEALSSSVAIEHIGSTSVPIRGKPIVDIQVTVGEQRVGDAVAAVVALGYTHHGQAGVPGREYLTRRTEGETPVNVHVFASGDPRADDNLRVRDYLRAHPTEAAAYAAAKARAVDEGHDTLLAYSRAKADHTAALRDAARAWALSRPRGA